MATSSSDSDAASTLGEPQLSVHIGPLDASGIEPHYEKQMDHPQSKTPPLTMREFGS
eukprot:ANDGO_07263.mRNA.1 hypothetical protein